MPAPNTYGEHRSEWWYRLLPLAQWVKTLKSLMPVTQRCAYLERRIAVGPQSREFHMQLGAIDVVLPLPEATPPHTFP